MTRKTIGWTGLTAIPAGFVATNWPAHGFLHAVALLALMATLFIIVMFCLWLIANDVENEAAAPHDDDAQIYGDYPYIAHIDGTAPGTMHRGFSPVS